MIVFDTESDGFVYDATKIHCICIVDTDNPTQVDSYYGNSLEDGLGRLSEAETIVAHNIIKHDIPLIQKLYTGWTHNLVIDTLVLSALLNPERLGGHGIEAWARRMGGEQKVQHDDWSTFSMDMLARCQSDTRLNKRVLDRLMKEAYAPIEGVDIYNFDFEEYAP